MRTPEFKSLRVILGVVSRKHVAIMRHSLVLGDELLHFPGVTIIVTTKLSQIIPGRRICQSALFGIQALLVVRKLREEPVL